MKQSKAASKREEENILKSDTLDHTIECVSLMACKWTILLH